MDIEELVRQERLEYFRRWRRENKDKVRLHNANYWRRRAEKRQKEIIEEVLGDEKHFRTPGM